MADPPATTLQPTGAGRPDGLLATKLYLPQLQPGFLARSRLAEGLDEGLARGLVLVCAPAAFGKTALLADWARQGRRPVVTADALHCQRATTEYVHGRGGDFALPVKDNQPGLFDALDALPWHQAPVTHTATGRSHGRIETRTIQVLDTPGDLPFPHVSQAHLIERHVAALDGTPLSDVAAPGVTSLDATRATPETIAGLVRGQRAIESLHWLRDTLYREDQSQVRTRSGPRAMATLRNLAVGALHLAGRHDTTEATRWASRSMDRPFTILELTPL
jgi:predicted transposase YbfD/YdcC